MAHIVCLMTVKERSATFTWSEGAGAFEPYTLDGMDYDGKNGFKPVAESARVMLANLTKDCLHAHGDVPASTFELAKAGFRLYEKLFPDDSLKATQVRKWLEALAQDNAVDAIEIVVDSPWSLPWNVIYDRQPTVQEFLGENASSDRWRPFWGVKYNMCGGRKVDPLRRMPIIRDPHVLLVVDPEIRDGLPDVQRANLIEFINTHDVTVVHTRNDLENAVAEQRPDLLYWLSHATARALTLSGEDITPSDVRELLKQKADDKIRFGGLAFLNACQTAEVTGNEGSFFEAFHKAGFAGMIGTEHQTINTFASPLGLDFLRAVLDEGQSVGAALWQLRSRVPLGLLYGTYCPPDIRVQRKEKKQVVQVEQLTSIDGIALGGMTAAIESNSPLVAVSPLPLPSEPYRSLAYYERRDRALFAGREDDIERFAAYLDDHATRLLVLHGESGVGKSSFLHAGVIPFLEEDCLGYRFLRRPDNDDAAGIHHGSVIFIRATNDLFGQLAQALWAFCAQPYEYKTPLQDHVTVNLPELLAAWLPPLGTPGDHETGQRWKFGPATYLREDPLLLSRILSAISERLPFSVILVIDQGEEIFTLAQSPEERQRGRQALDMLRQTVNAAGDFKVIFALRTEYYGRVIDRLRRGLHDTGGIREYLLTDFDEPSLSEAIRRPTADETIPYSSEIPFAKYRFQYAAGVAEEITSRLIRYTAKSRDGVLPLMQVICTQLYQLALQRPDRTIMLADLESLGGIEGGMRRHVDGLLGDLLRHHREDKRPVQELFTLLYLRQPDGTLTTALLPQDELQERWAGRMSFDALLESCGVLRLLKVNSLRIGGDVERRHVSLGHDSLARIAAEWHEAFTRGDRVRKLVGTVIAVSAVAVLMAMMAAWGWQAQAEARKAERKALHTAQQIAGLYVQPLARAGDIAAEDTVEQRQKHFTSWQSNAEPRVSSGEIEAAVDKLGANLGDRSEARHACLGLAKALRLAWESRPHDHGLTISGRQSREQGTAEDVALEVQLITKPLCGRAIKVTQDIVDASRVSIEAVLAHRKEFERLYWAELYWVEVAEMNLGNTGRSPLARAMITFQEEGLQEWKLDTVSKERTAELRKRADEVRRCCHDLIRRQSQPAKVRTGARTVQ